MGRGEAGHVFVSVSPFVTKLTRVVAVAEQHRFDVRPDAGPATADLHAWSTPGVTLARREAVVSASAWSS
jgi:hypothetical protein